MTGSLLEVRPSVNAKNTDGPQFISQKANSEHIEASSSCCVGEISLRTFPKALLRWSEIHKPGNISLMNNKSHNHFRQILLALMLLTLPAPYLATAPAQSAPNIAVNGSVMGGNARRGRTAQAVVVMEIPSGFHVNSSRPLEKFLIATQLQIEAPEGVKVGQIIYPRPLCVN